MIQNQKDDQNNFNSSNTTSNIQNNSFNLIKQKIKIDLKNPAGPNVVSEAEKFLNIKSSANPQNNSNVSYINFNNNNSLNISTNINNQNVMGSDQMHKQLNYQILKTISNKDNSNTVNSNNLYNIPNPNLKSKNFYSKFF